MSMRPKDNDFKVRRVPRFDPEGLPEVSVEELRAADGAISRGLERQEMLEHLTKYLGDGVFAQRFIDCMEIIRAKNADYSQGEQKGDRVAAFRRIARDMDLPIRKVWGTFFMKHWGAIVKYLKDGFVESEPLDGRINDAINYLVLLGVIASEEQA